MNGMSERASSLTGMKTNGTDEDKKLLLRDMAKSLGVDYE